jgi:hypothetical protein
MRHFVKIRHRFKIPISLPVVTFRSPLGILPFLSAVRAKREKKMKYDPSASLVQTVFSFISRPSVESKEKKNEIQSVSRPWRTVQSAQKRYFWGGFFFMTTANADMNLVHGELRGPSMVYTAPVDEGKRPGNSGNDSRGPGNEENYCGRL